MKAEQLGLGLTAQEIATVRKSLGREPNETEWSIIDAEWSEHSSYKSSRGLLKLFPTTGKRVVLGPGYDAGVVDVGDGYVVTLHIESHNHPSAVDPYGGASTGIGGVLRDILSVASRPIALVDILRFGLIDKSGHSRWLLKNVVRGIADYGNCVGVATVAGEIEFDDSFERNCLVDVACVGLGKKGDLILGEAKAPGDVLVLIGGSTGRDGIKGATFASKNLKEDAGSERSSVQVPDPFMKKLLLDSLLEIVANRGDIRGMKDLGGGGLSTALSEVASKGGTGVDVELKRVRLREDDMSPTEIMTSESQERMLLVLPSGPGSGKDVIPVLEKYGVPYSVIGKVTSSPRLVLRWDGKVVADLLASLVTDAPLIDWPYKKPATPRISPRPAVPADEPPLRDALLALLSSPNIASKRWVYQQYDHEVGLRTVVKPGQADAAVMRLPNGRFIAIKGDGNSRHSSLDPYEGAAGCVAEACRNVVAVGAEPIALVDHLQSGDPSDPEVYWAFRENLRGMADYCKAFGLPVVGGKVSFYNEDSATGRAIKPSPIALVVGLASKESGLRTMAFKRAGDAIVVVGETRPEMAGSELSARFPKSITVPSQSPHVDAQEDLKTCRAILQLIEKGLVDAVHDCSGGGLGVALAEMAISGSLGAKVDLALAPSSCSRSLETAFSESHGRFVVSGRDGAAIASSLRGAGVPHAVVGKVGGSSLSLSAGGPLVASVPVSSMRKKWEGAIPELMD
ncbi:MAG TPA: phosphoribosylformylglycinamidine synthase subunit PurL [Nitrososphaerales archaeon]|nr:phosphoribosylformylglycinamidine synthase subunit PurL [Nitrososphaerales archaeon]